MSDRSGSLKLLFPKLEIQVPRRGNCSFSMWELEFLRVETRVSCGETKCFSTVCKGSENQLTIK